MKVYLAPGLFRNIEISVIDGVCIDEMDIRDDKLKAELLKRYRDGIVKLWALKDTLYPQWKSVDKGDYVLFYHRGKIIYGAKICFKYPFKDDPKQVEVGNYLAESVWGKDIDGRTWPYILFLEDVRELNISLSKLNELTGYNLKYVREFMKIREKRSQKLIEFLREIYASRHGIPSIVKTEEEPSHERIVNIIYALGEIIGYEPAKKWRHEGYEFDVVWHKPPRVGPKYVFEVHLRGSLEAALLRFKHAYDLWESNIFLVSTEDQLIRAKDKFLGELHELKDKITLLTIEEIRSFYEFKGKFEWLERKFGLRPR